MNIKQFSILGLLTIFIIGAILVITIITIGIQAISNLNNAGCIAKVEIKGPIMDETDEDTSIFAPEPPPSAREIIKEIRQADKDENVKGILIYIDSPGGEAIPSRELYETINNCSKPTVAYIRSYGTSGAYYAAAGADYIIAEPESIVGNIGVRATFLSAKELFENIGIDYETVKTGEMKDIGDIGKPLSDDEKQLVQEMLNEIFSDFKKAVISSRGSLNGEVFDGRIFSGKQAVKYHLIDETGNEDRAVKKIAELAGISDKKYEVCPYSEGKPSFIRAFLQNLTPLIKVDVNFEPQKMEMSLS